MLRNLVFALSGVLSPFLLASAAYAEGAPQPSGSGGLVQMILFILPIFVLFWLFIIRPEKKRKQEHEQMIANLKKGDEVLTIGGIFGTIVEVRDDKIILEIADKTRVKITPGSVSSLIEAEKAAE
ncbi:MAG: preprotein translocase subunit YajC [Planctomycetota bacterium]